MMDLKNYLNIDKIKPLAIAGVCFAAVFAAGYGVGKSGADSASASKRSLSNYNTNTQQATQTEATAQAANTATPTVPTSTDKTNCYIKGSKSKIYHMPGGSFYERTNPAACFNSEEEAVGAGYKKSSR